MAEWNRWPVFTAQKRKHIPFKQPNPYGHQGQLDYDLTLRDQRMLKNLNSIPRRTKLSLRNSLTLRYPAVPVPTKTHSETYNLKEDKDFNILGLTDPYIGTVVNKGFNLTEKVRKKYWQDKIDKRLEGKERPKAYWEYPELEKGHIHKVPFIYYLSSKLNLTTYFLHKNWGFFVKTEDLIFQHYILTKFSFCHTA